MDDPLLSFFDEIQKVESNTNTNANNDNDNDNETGKRNRY